MARNQDVERAREAGEYIVFLPEINLGGIYGARYTEIPREGRTKAVSEAHAVSQFVMRNCEDSPELGKGILSIMKGREKDLGKFAVAVPRLAYENGHSISTKHRYLLEHSAVALELASKESRSNPTQKDVDKAWDLLKIR